MRHDINTRQFASLNAVIDTAGGQKTKQTLIDFYDTVKGATVMAINALDMIKKHRIVPVTAVNRLEDTDIILSALCDGGLPVAEIVFRTACAGEAIERGVKKFPHMTIGAGTVINKAQCERAIGAGAGFIVSPGFSRELAEICAARKVLYLPGCVTPTEIMLALESNLAVVKFFPAGIYGGVRALKALSAPFGAVKFVPTGGVNESNLREYSECESVLAVGGSWMLDTSDYAQIKAKTERAVAIARSAGGGEQI
ncbi:MAG: bifunctional 4-hydroxy-2-oxoglutarate aldolase/2-dehydro-3-deoxy-phosphogluconate aldolase [Clostridiales bacterium]|nr:bifunctional 4-hydroxy-2-oxoglutarate aldolase/2-dehydro-3-deoxy-phosphogluconate aldolase [Clostridiales bacterium]